VFASCCVAKVCCVGVQGESVHMVVPRFDNATGPDGRKQAARGSGSNSNR
jgi:hypothetical protein